ncbi:hypothetical protein ACQY0O_002210 [Thecaphora frezii]
MKLSLFACTLLAVSASARTTLYLSPSRPSPSDTVAITAAEANEILSHHLDIAHHGPRSDRAQIWDHVLKLDAAHDRLTLDHKAAVERLFDGASTDNKNRLLVVMHGTTDADVVPSSFSATHEMSSSPSALSIDALLGSYMNSLQQTLRINDAAFGHLSSGFFPALQSIAAGVEDAVEDAASWLMGSSAPAAEKATTSKWWADLDELVREKKSAALEVVQSELEALHGLLDRISLGDSHEDDLTFQALRFQGLGDVKATYGVDSIEYAKVKKIVKEAIQELTQAFESRSEAQRRDAAVAFVLNESEVKLAKRSASTRSLLKPFFGRDSASKLAKTKKPVNLLGTCFTEQSKFKEATNSCSGHGKAKQSSQGGRKCWRCQCQATKEKGRTTKWAGVACEKKDVSTEFVLLGSTGIFLALISVGSVYFLYNAGSAELPGTLAGVTINLK